jgi:hypothetical protein
LRLTDGRIDGRSAHIHAGLYLIVLLIEQSYSFLLEEMYGGKSKGKNYLDGNH